MYCRQCGTLNAQGAAICSSCSAALVSSSTSNPWPNDLETNPYSAPPSANLPGYTPPLGPATPPPFGKPESYLVFAVLATCCCCLPLGVPAIVYAAQVDSKWHIGDYHGAQFSSGEAKKWCWIAFGAGLIMQVLPLAMYAFMVLMVIASAAAGN